MTETQTQDIWKWKNTAHIAKVAMQTGFAIAAVAIAATTIYAAAKGVALSSVLPAFLSNPWVIAAIAFVAAVYLITTAISSYRQIYSMEEAKVQNGTSGINGRDADSSALVGDAIKGVNIVEEGEKLLLKFSSALLDMDKNQALHVILKDKEGKKYTSTAILNYKAEDKSVVVESVDIGSGKITGLDEIKKALGMAESDNPLKVAVSNEKLEALQGKVSAKLQEVALEAAISRALKK